MSRTAEVIEKAFRVMEIAVDADNEWWAWQGVAQDSQEAEDSGYLMGYRDALQACNVLVGLGLEGPLTDYITDVEETTIQRLAEMREETHAHREPDTDAPESA